MSRTLPSIALMAALILAGDVDALGNGPERTAPTPYSSAFGTSLSAFGTTIVVYEGEIFVGRPGGYFLFPVPGSRPGGVHVFRMVGGAPDQVEVVAQPEVGIATESLAKDIFNAFDVAECDSRPDASAIDGEHPLRPWGKEVLIASCVPHI